MIISLALCLQGRQETTPKKLHKSENISASTYEFL
jgi:hypothetical protein